MTKEYKQDFHGPTDDISLKSRLPFFNLKKILISKSQLSILNNKLSFSKSLEINSRYEF